MKRLNERIKIKYNRHKFINEIINNKNIEYRIKCLYENKQLDEIKWWTNKIYIEKETQYKEKYKRIFNKRHEFIKKFIQLIK